VLTFNYVPLLRPAPSRPAPSLVHRTQWHKRIRGSSETRSLVLDFLQWLRGEFKPGKQGDPMNDKVMCRPPEQDDTED